MNPASSITLEKKQRLNFNPDPFALLKLLYIYQGIISSRPIEMGNLEFLECMLSASRNIIANLNKSEILKPDLVNKLKSLNTLIEFQTNVNPKKISLEILNMISTILRDNYIKRPNKLHIQTTLPYLPNNYNNIHIIFGPGLGLGDQITFYSFLKYLFRHCPKCQMSIYTLYPGLWRNLFPQAIEIQYRHKPLRPFYKLSQLNTKTFEKAHRLVVLADFDNFNFHQDFISSRGNDILEIALGRSSVWLNQSDSPWIKSETFTSMNTIGNNYSFLSNLADRLFKSEHPFSAWEPVFKPSLQTSLSYKKTIFLNPFTSKKYELHPEDWYIFLTLLKRKLNDEIDWNIIVFPGLNKESQLYAKNICQLCQSRSHRIQARILQSADRKLPTVYNTFDFLLKEIPNISLCITVDTFTGHFMPLYGITTLVVTDRDNKAFWVPNRWSYYCLLDRMKIALPRLAACILMAHKLKDFFHSDINELIGKIVIITETANQKGIDQLTMVEIQRLLFKILNQLSESFPYKDQAHFWLLQWSKLATAMKQDIMPPVATKYYVQNWQQSEFFKLITLTKE